MKLRAFFLWVAFFATGAAAHAEELDRAAGIADFEQIKAAVTEQSPNLEWQIVRGLDLAALEASARSRIAAAGDEASARGALERFVRAFGDGHMELSWPSNAGRRQGDGAVVPTCARLGFSSRADESAVVTGLPGYESASPDSAYVKAGTLTVAGRRVGALRIALFMPNEAMCAQALGERGLAAEAPCDATCEDDVSRRADALFLEEIAARIEALKARGAEALILDVAGNGGGNDSSIAVVRMLAGADVASPEMGVVRSAARARDIGEAETELRRAMRRASAGERRFLRGLADKLRRARLEAALPCDRSAAWSGEAVSCSQLVRGVYFAGGLVANELPEAYRARPWAQSVSQTARFRYEPGLWGGPLIVLVDGYSASSTELLAAMLQDARRATIFGAPTYGAGCGWHNLPHADVVLARSGGRLSMPNCARFRREGTNELDGVQPDVLVGLRARDTASQRAARVAEKLPAAIAVAMSR